MGHVIADDGVLRWLTAKVIARRFGLENERKARMALELKGLRAKATAAASHIDRLNKAYDKFNEAAPKHAADVEGLAPQVEALSEDLTFAAQTLGNSVAGSGEGEKEPEPKQQLRDGVVMRSAS